MTEHRDLRKLLEIIFFTGIILVAIAYGGWKAYPLLAGPGITVFSPHDNDAVATTSFEITGQVARVKEITLQGRPIPIDIEGKFDELLVVQAPYTTIVLTASDFYGKVVTKTLRVTPKE